MLTFRDVTLVRAGRPILDAVSFDVPARTVFTILGPSGAGKSTLLRLANRLEDPTSGEILFGGKDVRDLDVLSLRRQVGFLAQEPVLFGESVRENLEFAGGPAEDGVERLRQVGLSGEFLPRKPDTLSVGQRQRVALARALVPGPDALLLDEPTSALDPPAAAGILRLVRDLRDRLDLTIVVVTHSVWQARRVADRVLVLADGRILEAGGPEIFDDPESGRTRAFFAAEEE